MTDAAEPSSSFPAPRRFVFTTTEADALALEAILKPADRGWRSLLGYAFALPPLIVVSWFTRNAEWPLWFAAFGLAGLCAWQAARFALKAERSRAARRHPVGTGDVTFHAGRFEGSIGGSAIAVTMAPGRRVEVDVGHVFVMSGDAPALILPLPAFASPTDMLAFAAALKV